MEGGRKSERSASPRVFPEGQIFFRFREARSAWSAFSPSSIYTGRYSPTNSTRTNIHSIPPQASRPRPAISGAKARVNWLAIRVDSRRFAVLMTTPHLSYNNDKHPHRPGNETVTSIRTEAAPSPAAREHTREKIKNTYHTKKHQKIPHTIYTYHSHRIRI